ncbi:MAG: DUF6250 domain-containing protein [Chthoniobacteraceae bacterium]
MRACLHTLAGALLVFTPLEARETAPASPDSRYVIGDCLYQDDFSNGLSQWQPELEKGGSLSARDGTLTVDVPGGCSLWFKSKLDGPVLIQYEATAVSQGGGNDRVSDLNCFWMARDSRSPANVFATARTGKFSDYNQLLTYYAGIGGNSNKTTRFRRYIGDAVNRPLRPQDDLPDAADLLQPNRSQTIQLVADGPLIQLFRDGKKLFEMNDPAPYTSGWFALRTVQSHLTFRHFRVWRLKSPH